MNFCAVNDQAANSLCNAKERVRYADLPSCFVKLSCARNKNDVGGRYPLRADPDSRFPARAAPPEDDPRMAGFAHSVGALRRAPVKICRPEIHIPAPPPSEVSRRFHRTIFISDIHLGTRGCKAECCSIFFAATRVRRSISSATSSTAGSESLRRWPRRCRLRPHSSRRPAHDRRRPLSQRWRLG